MDSTLPEKEKSRSVVSCGFAKIAEHTAQGRASHQRGYDPHYECS